jgi:predicted O-linked N-acetylglucosamine transferase (SPINDLY family)
MGVPVLTLPGKRFSARHGLTHLSALGLTEFLAADPDLYVSKALECTTSLTALSALRASLRVRMATSPLLDAAAVARQVESIYRREWHALLATL